MLLNSKTPNKKGTDTTITSSSEQLLQLLSCHQFIADYGHS